MTTLLFSGVHHVHHVHLAQPCGLQRGHRMDTAWCPVSIKSCFIRLAVSPLPNLNGVA